MNREQINTPELLAVFLEIAKSEIIIDMAEGENPMKSLFENS